MVIDNVLYSYLVQTATHCQGLFGTRNVKLLLNGHKVSGYTELVSIFRTESLLSKGELQSLLPYLLWRTLDNGLKSIKGEYGHISKC